MTLTREQIHRLEDLRGNHGLKVAFRCRTGELGCQQPEPVCDDR